MRNSIPVLIAAVLLGGCSSRGELIDDSEYDLGPRAVTPRGDLIGRSEDYTGPQTAAVAPVTDRRSRRSPSDEALRTDIQLSIQRQLDQSGIFAGVVALERSDEGNEAEVIIEPALVTRGGYGGDDVGLRIRVLEKTRRRIVLDTSYEGNDPSNTLQVALNELEDDLGRRY